jgi:hypothetical protein
MHPRTRRIECPRVIRVRLKALSLLRITVLLLSGLAPASAQTSPPGQAVQPPNSQSCQQGSEAAAAQAAACVNRLQQFVPAFCGSAAAETAGGRLAASKVDNASNEVAPCPSQDFAAFFGAFAQRPSLQRQYTILPLDYGRVDADLVGTDKEDEAFTKRAIRRFEDIPSYDSNGAILPTASEMVAKGLRIQIITKSNSEMAKDADPETIITDPNIATATLFLPDSGFRVHYRFNRSAACWFLYSIVDRSI